MHNQQDKLTNIPAFQLMGQRFLGGDRANPYPADALELLSQTSLTTDSSQWPNFTAFLSLQRFQDADKPQLCWFHGWHLQGRFWARPGRFPPYLHISRSPGSWAHNPEPSAMFLNVVNVIDSCNSWKSQLRRKSHGYRLRPHIGSHWHPLVGPYESLLSP